MVDKVERMWVNQPSTFQPYNKWHGIRVLAHFTDAVNGYGKEVVRVFFLEGPVVSMDMQARALSRGWPETSRVGRTYRKKTT